MSKGQSDTLGLIIVLALLLLFLNPKVRAIWPALFTKGQTRSDFNPFDSIKISLPGGFGVSGGTAAVSSNNSNG